jgi:Putative prokaryotic signal transducing protein
MKWIIANSYNDYFKANIALTKLQTEGIETMLKDENTVTLDPMLGNAIGGIKLMIKEEDIEKVLAILSDGKKKLMKFLNALNAIVVIWSGLQNKHLKIF